MADMINNPPHYAGTNGIEAMDALESCMGESLMLGFYWGNAFKYLWRWRKKNGIEDLEKCKYYIDKLIEFEKKEEQEKLKANLKAIQALSDDTQDWYYEQH